MALEHVERLRQRRGQVQRARQRLADLDERGEPADLAGRATRAGYNFVVGDGHGRRNCSLKPRPSDRPRSRKVRRLSQFSRIWQVRQVRSGSAKPIIIMMSSSSHPRIALPSWTRQCRSTRALDADRKRDLYRALLFPAAGRGEDADPAAAGTAVEVVLGHRAGSHRRRRRRRAARRRPDSAAPSQSRRLHRPRARSADALPPVARPRRRLHRADAIARSISGRRAPRRSG